MTIRSLSLLLACASLMACAQKKGTDAVDKDGNCTETTRNYYNSAIANTESYRTSANPQDLKNAINDCNRFKSLIGDQSCSGTDENGKELTVTQESITPICNRAQEILKELSLKKNQKSDPDSDPGDQILPAPGSENKIPKKSGKGRGRG